MCSWAHAMIFMTGLCLFLMQCHWGTETQEHLVLICPLSHVHIDLSRSSESFGDIMYCRLWFTVIASLCWGTVFWNCSRICNAVWGWVLFVSCFFFLFFADRWTSACFYIWETFLLEDGTSFCCQLTLLVAKCCYSCFFFSTTYLSSALFSYPDFFEM